MFGSWYLYWMVTVYSICLDRQQLKISNLFSKIPVFLHTLTTYFELQFEISTMVCITQKRVFFGKLRECLAKSRLRNTNEYTENIGS